MELSDQSPNSEWTTDEDVQLCDAVVRSRGDFEHASKALNYTRSAEECAARASTVKRRGQWTRAEDDYLRELVNSAQGLNVAGGGGASPQWVNIATLIPGRTGKQCRERYKNHLAPGICKKAWTSEEDAKLVELQQVFGNSWCRIAREMPGRAENAVKNRWNGMFNKRVGALVAAQGRGAISGMDETSATDGGRRTDSPPTAARTATKRSTGRRAGRRFSRDTNASSIGAPNDGLFDSFDEVTTEHDADSHRASQYDGPIRTRRHGGRERKSTIASLVESSTSAIDLSFEDLSIDASAHADSLQLLSLSNLSTENLSWSADDTAQTSMPLLSNNINAEPLGAPMPMPTVPPMPSPAPMHSPMHIPSVFTARSTRGGFNHSRTCDAGNTNQKPITPANTPPCDSPPVTPPQGQFHAHAGVGEKAMNLSPTGDTAEEARARIRRRVAECNSTGTKRKLGARRMPPLPLHVPQLPQLNDSTLYTGHLGGECAEHAERSGYHKSSISALQTAGLGMLSSLVSPPAKRRLSAHPSLTPLSPCPSPGAAGALPEEWWM